MTETRNKNNTQSIIFLFCLIIFCISAVFGWNKLHYGFNFVDEGYHATESWRLAAGDHFLDDKITGALMHYTLISSIIFKIYPEISLLQLRQLQFILTICSLLIFGIALFRQSGQYAWLPFVFSLFAFTGLDAAGMISNFYYQTYPHLFVVFHLSFVLFAFQSPKRSIRKIFFVLSGICLWLMSLSLLHLGTIVFSPIILFLLSRKVKLKGYSFAFNDLLFVISPFAACWVLFVVIFNKPYLLNLYNSVALFLPSYSSAGLIHIDWYIIKYITVSLCFLLIALILIKALPSRFFVAGCAVVSIIILLMIDTRLFIFIIPYRDAWQIKPIWFSSFLMAFTVLFWFYAIYKYFLRKTFSKEEELAIILMVPFTVCSLTMCLFSSIGILAAAQCAIPAVAAISYIFASNLRNIRYRNAVTAVILILLLAPFYYTTARSDWNFTFFDVQPKQLDVRIDTGFGRGIYTNRLYFKLYNWLIDNAQIFTKPDDYAISYAVSPMVHMITHLRPSLDDSFINFAKPQTYYEKCIEKMIQAGREPMIAFIFERAPELVPVSFEKGTVAFVEKEFDFQTSQDPLSIYVKTHMVLVSDLKMSDDNIIRCYVGNNLLKEQRKQ